MKERRMVFEERVVVGELHFVEVHRVLSSMCRMLRRAHFTNINPQAEEWTYVRLVEARVLLHPRPLLCQELLRHVCACVRVRVRVRVRRCVCVCVCACGT